jgi:type I restriction enzyme S subunit
LRMNCWDVYKIGELCDVITGSTPSRTNSEYWNEGSVPWFTVDDIRKGGRVIQNTIQHVTEKAVKESSLRLMPTDTVLLCCTASVGEYAITRVPITSNQQFNGLVIKSEFKDKLSADFLFNVASTLKEKLKAFCGKTSVDFVSGSNLKSIQIPLPPLAEQRKIAEILRTWDEAIETAEAELKAKQERKRWLMDKLLVGDWAVKKLDDLFELEGSGIDKVILQGEQVVPLVNYMDAYRKRILEPSDITAQTSVSPADLSRCKLQRGDIVLTPSSETPDDIAHSALIDFEPGDAVHSYHLFRLRARSNSAIIHDFRAFFLNHISVRKQFIRICSGTTRFTLTLPGVRGIKVSLPPAEHQKYAAAVLGDATSQESLASQRIEALRTQKRGLMQKLLTGEVWVAA